jgi:hypothetical protein
VSHWDRCINSTENATPLQFNTLTTIVGDEAVLFTTCAEEVVCWEDVAGQFVHRCFTALRVDPPILHFEPNWCKVFQNFTVR